MLGVGLVFALAAALVAIVRYVLTEEQGRSNMLRLMILAYGARLFYSLFLSDLPIFSYGAGGDSYGYELYAEAIAKIWDVAGVHYVTSAEVTELGPTTLPSNVFAVLVYAGGQAGARFGNGGLVAFLACLTCLNFYSLAVELGLERRRAFQVTTVWMFAPAFFLYTADTFKEGMVLFFVMTAFASSIRLARKFSLLNAVIGVVACVGLFGCRYYLIFVVLAPLFVSFIGLGTKNLPRQIVATAALVALFVALFTFSTLIEAAQNTADTAYDFGEAGALSNSRGGSGVTFDDGGQATGALHWKIIYTLLSPFPWQTGSIALQLGKIEALLWYYFIYRNFIVGKRLIKENPALLLMFLVFIIPTTVMYALFMSNVGLVVRERMPIVMLGTLLGALSWAKPGALRWGKSAAQGEAASDATTDEEPSAATAE